MDKKLKKFLEEQIAFFEGEANKSIKKANQTLIILGFLFLLLIIQCLF